MANEDQVELKVYEAANHLYRQSEAERMISDGADTLGYLSPKLDLARERCAWTLSGICGTSYTGDDDYE